MSEQHCTSANGRNVFFAVSYGQFACVAWTCNWLQNARSEKSFVKVAVAAAGVSHVACQTPKCLRQYVVSAACTPGYLVSWRLSFSLSICPAFNAAAIRACSCRKRFLSPVRTYIPGDGREHVFYTGVALGQWINSPKAADWRSGRNMYSSLITTMTPKATTKQHKQENRKRRK